MKPEASLRLYTREKRSGKLLVRKRIACFLVGACLCLFPENLYLLFPGDLKTVPGTRRRVPVFLQSLRRWVATGSSFHHATGFVLLQHAFRSQKEIPGSGAQGCHNI